MLKNILDLIVSETILPAKRSFLMEEDVRIGAAPAEKARPAAASRSARKAHTLSKNYVSKPALS